MNFLEPQDWSFPVPIVYGPNRLCEIAELSVRAGMNKPLVVTDRRRAALPFISDLQSHLSRGGMASALYANISPNPRDDEIAMVKAQYTAGDHEGVIAISAGSGMDGGKALALTANNDLDLWTFEYRQTPPDMSARWAFPPLITILTTAGTDAETESTAMVTDTARMMKRCLWHAELTPAFAVLDRELTIGLPANLTAWTGVDAMVRAIEAYCVPGFNPLFDGMAVEGLRLVAHWMPVAVAEPSKVEAPGAMLTGSCLSRIAFLKGLGLLHTISHMVGGEYVTQHGLTNAIVLLAVLRHKALAMTYRVAVMAQAMGLSDTSFEAFYTHICALLDQLGIPKTLVEIGVVPDCAARIAGKALKDSAAGTNALALTLHDIEQVIAQVLASGRQGDAIERWA